MNNIFMSSKDARSLISTIMPQAIESIDFSLPKNFNKEVVRFYIPIYFNKVAFLWNAEGIYGFYFLPSCIPYGNEVASYIVDI